MKLLGWLAAAIGGFIVFSSFRSETTTPGSTTTGDQTFSPPKVGYMNKTVSVTVKYSVPENSKMMQKANENIQLLANETVSVIGYIESQGTLVNGYYLVSRPGNGVAYVLKPDISFKTSYNAADIIDEIVISTTGNSNNDNKVTTTQQQDLPADIYTPMVPAQTGKTLVAIPGINNFPYLNAGKFVSVTGSKVHYAFNSKNVIVFTNLYEIELNGIRRFVQKESIQLTGTLPGNSNVEKLIGLEKYSPAKIGTFNKQATAFTVSGSPKQIAQGTAVQVNGSGILHTNHFGAWEDIPVLDCNNYGTRIIARKVDVNM